MEDVADRSAPNIPATRRRKRRGNDLVQYHFAGRPGRRTAACRTDPGPGPDRRRFGDRAATAADKTTDAAAASSRVDELTVTAESILNELIPQVAATTSVTVVTSPQLAAQQIRSLADVTRLVPGLVTGARRGVGQPTSISIRGLGQRNVRTFLDGIEMSDTSQAQSNYQISEQDFDTIERVEVFRGPQPGRFGTGNAGGGDQHHQQAPDPQRLWRHGRMGRLPHLPLQRLGQYVHDRVDLRLNASGTYSKGYSDFNELRGGIAEDPYRQWTVSGRGGYDLTPTLRVEVNGHYQREDIFYDNTNIERDWNRDESERFGSVRLSHRAMGDKLVQDLSYANSKDHAHLLGLPDQGRHLLRQEGRLQLPGSLQGRRRDLDRLRGRRHPRGYRPEHPRLRAPGGAAAHQLLGQGRLRHRRPDLRRGRRHQRLDPRRQPTPSSAARRPTASAARSWSSRQNRG